MFTVTIKREKDNRSESGYGIYINAFVSWDGFERDIPLMYASECVPFGQTTDENLKAAEQRVRRSASAKAKREWVG